MVRLSWKSSICLVALASFVGCPGGGDTGVDTVSVSGTVTLDGSPVEGASVAFSPKGSDGRAAAGITDASGHFTLTTVQSGDGALPGSYTVTVSKTSGGAAFVDPRDKMATGGELTEEESKAMAAMAQGDAPAVTDALPAKYKSAADSGLSAEVKRGEENDFTFELTSS